MKTIDFYFYKYFPLFIGFVFVFDEILNYIFSGLFKGVMLGVDLIYYLIFIYFIFIKKYNYTKSELIFTYALKVVYLFCIASLYISYDMEKKVELIFFKDIVRSMEVFLFLLVGFNYCKLFGYNRLLKITYVYSIIYLFLRYYLSFFESNKLHEPFLGFIFIVIFIFSSFTKFKYRVFPTVVLLFSILAIFLGSTRTGISIVVLSFILTIIFSYKYNDFLQVKKIFIYLLSGTLLFALMSVKFFFVHVGNKNILDLLLFSKSQDSLNGRDKTWETLYELFLNNIWFGNGFFSQLEIVYQHQTTNIFYSHNILLSILSGGGLFLFIPYMLFWSLIIIMIIKNWMKSKQTFIGFLIILSIVIVFLANTYFAHFFKGSLLWTFLGMGIYLLISDPKKQNLTRTI